MQECSEQDVSCSVDNTTIPLTTRRFITFDHSHRVRDRELRSVCGIYVTF